MRGAHQRRSFREHSRVGSGVLYLAPREPPFCPMSLRIPTEPAPFPSKHSVLGSPGVKVGPFGDLKGLFNLVGSVSPRMEDPFPVNLTNPSQMGYLNGSLIKKTFQEWPRCCYSKKGWGRSSALLETFMVSNGGEEERLFLH